MIGDFITKPTQGAAFKRLRDKFMGVTKAKDPGTGKPKKYREYQILKYGQKAARNAAPNHRSVLEWVSLNRHSTAIDTLIRSF